MDVLVLKEYQKNPDIRPSYIHSLRDWLSSQTHLPKEYITDFDLILACHRCDGNLEATKNVIDLNFTLRTLFGFYKNRKLDGKLRTALRTWLIKPLETTSKQGYRAIYCHLLDTNLENFVYEDVVKAFVMIIDLWLSEEGTSPGIILIVNMDKVSLGHLSRIDLTVAQQFFYFLQEAMFVRLKEFHFINAPSLIDTLMSLMRPFLKKELFAALKIHKVGSDSFEECLPASALVDSETRVIPDEIWKKLKKNEKFFEEESKKRVDESKRPGGPKTIATFFSSIESTFKCLNID